MEQEHRRLTGSFSIQDSIQSLTSSLGSQSTLLSSCAGTLTDATDLLFISFPCYCCHSYFFSPREFLSVIVVRAHLDWSLTLIDHDLVESISLLVSVFADQPSLKSQGWLMIAGYFL